MSIVTDNGYILGVCIKDRNKNCINFGYGNMRSMRDIVKGVLFISYSKNCIKKYFEEIPQTHNFWNTHPHGRTDGWMDRERGGAHPKICYTHTHSLTHQHSSDLSSQTLNVISFPLIDFV